MKKYIFAFLIAFCVGLSLSFLFHFINDSSASASASASTTEKTYEGTLSENFSTFNDLGLTSIEGLYVENGAVVYMCDFTYSCGSGSHSYKDISIQWACTWCPTEAYEAYGNCFIQNFNSYALNNSTMNLNYAILCNSSSTEGIKYFVPAYDSSLPYNYARNYSHLYLVDGYNYSIYFSHAPLAYNTTTKSVYVNYSDLTYGVFYDYTFKQDFSSLLDFNSETNFELDVLDFPLVNKDNSSYSYSFGERAVSMLETRGSIDALYYTWDTSAYTYISCYDYNKSFFYTGSSQVQNPWQSNVLMKTFWFSRTGDIPKTETQFYAPSFYFIIERPFSRVNNTLCVYSYNYSQILNVVESCKYQLRLEDTYYTVNYGESLPSDYKYMYINVAELNNIIFDEYIYFYLNFDDDQVKLTSTSSFSTTIPFGFDFNFTFYTEPLVVNSEIYDYKFDKPDYVDMPFSLYPFYIPVLEIVENAIIFVVFYCPVIADVISLVGLNYIIGGLLQIITFLTDFAMPQLGTFIFGLFSFFVFMKFIQFLWPMAINAGKGLYEGVKGGISRAYHKSNRYRYKQEKKHIAKSKDYELYKNRKDYDKSVKTLRKYNKKVERKNKRN